MHISGYMEREQIEKTQHLTVNKVPLTKNRCQAHFITRN